MYQVSLTNLGTHFQDKFNSFEQAIEFCKSKGFECTIHDLKNGGVAGTWSVIGGIQDWRK